MVSLPLDPHPATTNEWGCGPPLWILPPKGTYYRESLESHRGFQRGRAPFVSLRGVVLRRGTQSKVSTS